MGLGAREFPEIGFVNRDRRPSLGVGLGGCPGAGGRPGTGVPDPGRPTNGASGGPWDRRGVRESREAAHGGAASLGDPRGPAGRTPAFPYPLEAYQSWMKSWTR